MMEENDQIRMIDSLFDMIIRNEDIFVNKNKNTIKFANKIIHAKYKLDLARYGIDNLPYPLEAYEEIRVMKEKKGKMIRVPLYLREMLKEIKENPNYIDSDETHNDAKFRKFTANRILREDVLNADPDIPFDRSMEYYGDFVIDDPDDIRTRKEVWDDMMAILGNNHKKTRKRRRKKEDEAKKYKRKYMTLARKAKKLLSKTFSL